LKEQIIKVECIYSDDGDLRQILFSAFCQFLQCELEMVGINAI